MLPLKPVVVTNASLADLGMKREDLVVPSDLLVKGTPLGYLLHDGSCVGTLGSFSNRPLVTSTALCRNCSYA